MNNERNVIWVAFRCGRYGKSDEMLACARTYEEVEEQAKKQLKPGESMYLRTFIQEGCGVNEGTEEHELSCPNCKVRLKIAVWQVGTTIW
jgi:hypothetical protein